MQEYCAMPCHADREGGRTELGNKADGIPELGDTAV